MPSPSEPPWHQHLTLDLLLHVLSRSLFHPFIAALIPLSLRAITTPYTAPSFIFTTAWAVLVTLFHLLAKLNQRIAFGPPRILDWENEVVVITGGASGLGRVLAEMFSMKGVGVAVLDVAPKPEENEGLQNMRFYHCDVSDIAAVQAVKPLIEKDLGPPTILLNNAGISTPSPLLSLSPALLTRNLHINLHAHFHTLHTFLPTLLTCPTGGTIITIASVLGKLGCSHLSDYTAAKAGLIAMHNSLRAELSSPSALDGASGIRMVLVTPGQIATGMFSAVRTPSQFFGPVVEPVELAREILRVVESGMSAEVSLPAYARWVEWMGVLPVGAREVLRRMTGMDGAMEGMVERRRVGGDGIEETRKK